MEYGMTKKKPFIQQQYLPMVSNAAAIVFVILLINAMQLPKLKVVGKLSVISFQYKTRLQPDKTGKDGKPIIVHGHRVARRLQLFSLAADVYFLKYYILLESLERVTK